MSAQGPAQILAPMSRIDRVAGRGIRDRDRKRRDDTRGRPSRAEVEAYELLIERLTTIHQVAFDRIDWAKLEAEGPVVPTVARDAISAAARHKLANYRPSLFDNLLGLEREKRRELTNRMVEAAKADAELYGRAKAQADAHNRTLALAADVRALKVEAIAGVLKANRGAATLKDVIEGFRLHVEGPNRLIGEIDLFEYDALPDEACTPAAYKPLTDAERCRLQLANACAVALRAAVEVLRTAPVDAVEIVARRCRPGGFAETDLEPVLHVKVTAAALASLQLQKADAVTTIADMRAQIDWTPARGLVPIRIDDPAIVRLTTPRVAA
ncbi:MAG: hypothetical protein EPO51_26380 [Phenylobacterium sp.]|uniref:hypothetical protein n=1 Tax=Phenylobacterium sp. TaxID=1871053 RepID=UPI001229F5FF|nr:hypothetical protein [Phenylobacterium sp.]TAJ68422.1 MAG: hypothetical protein EPO51_26380 [Phenylobacterium sp.]